MRLSYLTDLPCHQLLQPGTYTLSLYTHILAINHRAVWTPQECLLSCQMIVKSKQGPNLISVQHVSALSEIKLRLKKRSFFSPRKGFYRLGFWVVLYKHLEEYFIMICSHSSRHAISLQSITWPHFCIKVNTRKHMIAVPAAVWLFLAAIWNGNYEKKICYCTHLTEEHLLAAIKWGILICQCLHVHMSSHLTSL